MNRQMGNYVIKITIRFIFRWNFIQHFKKGIVWLSSAEAHGCANRQQQLLIWIKIKLTKLE